jgi:broad specificity phosphatase PhoE
MRAGRFPDDDPLDERGLAEAAAAVAAMPLRHVCVGTREPEVWCSPARCAQQTAEAFGLRTGVEAALRDADYGAWRGKRLIDIRREMPDALATWTRDPTAAPHGGESFEHVMRRVGAWLDGFALQSSVGSVVVAVTHAVVVRAAIAHTVGADANAVFKVDVAPLSCTTLVLASDGWTFATG